MKGHPELLDVLDRCLADVRAGRRTVEDCLEEHRTHRAELEVLLLTAAAIVPSHAAPDPAAKLRARFALVEAIHADVGARPSLLLAALLGLRQRTAAIATAIVLTITSSGVAVVAAQDAQPYEPLYPLKTAVEQQQVAFAGSPEARAQLRLQIAARRLAEAERAIEAGREAAAVFAAAAYGETMQRAYDDMDAAQGEGRGAAEAHEAADESLARLHDVTARANTAGSREAAAALAAAAAQAERERAERGQSASPPRPAAPPIPPTPRSDLTQTEASAPVAHVVDDDPETDVEEAPTAAERVPDAPQAAVVPSAPGGAPGSRPSTPVSAGRGQGPGNSGGQAAVASPQRGGSGGSNDRDDRDERGRGGTEAGAGSERSRVAPTTAPRVLPTPTLQRSGGQREDRDDRSGHGRGREDNRARATPTRTPTPGARPAPSGDERARPTATSTNRSGSGDDRGGSSRPGNRDRDDDDDDRDRNRGRD
jgi:hypothetical protein